METLRCSKYSRVKNKSCGEYAVEAAIQALKGYIVATSVCIFDKAEDRFIKPVKNKTQPLNILLIHKSSHKIIEVKFLTVNNC